MVLQDGKPNPIFIKDIEKKYHGFQIIGKSGELIEPKEQGFYKGYRFDFDTWDGSDFFSPDGTHLRFISQRLKNLLIENKVTNVGISNIEDIDAYSFGS